MISGIKLKDGEKIFLIVRQSPIAFAGSISLSLLLFLIPFFLLFPLFSWGRPGVWIFSTLLALAFLFAIYKLVDWYYNCGIITNHRVIDMDQRGFFDRTISEVPYFKIDDVSYTISGIKQSTFKYGNVSVAIRGYRSSVILKNISKPWLVQELILEIERDVRGWDRDLKTPMDNIMEDVDKLSDIEKKALEVALKKSKHIDKSTKEKKENSVLKDEIYG